MAGWKPKKGILWSPRALLSQRQVAPATTRYEIKKTVEEEEDEDFKRINENPFFTNPHRTVERNHNKTHWAYATDGNDWDDPYGTEWYYGETYRPPVLNVKKQKKKKKDYVFNTNTWSSYNFNTSIYYNGDNNTELFVKDPETYLTPDTSEIIGKTQAYAVDAISQIKEIARVCYFKMLDERDYISEKWRDRGQLNDRQRQIYDKKKEMYDSLFDKFLPGYTPLEQAISYYNALKKTEEIAPHGNRDGNYLRVNFERKDYCNPSLNEQLDMSAFSKKWKLEILNKISLIGKLGDQFTVEKETNEREVHNSDIRVQRLMREYSQFSNIEIYQRLLPTFDIKFLMKDLIISTPVDRTEKKQKIIILIDHSGSMDLKHKQQWVNALLTDRMRYVMEGDAELFISYFNYSPEQLHFSHIKTREDVEIFWKHFSNYPTGGQTNIGGIVTHIKEEIDMGRLCNLDVNLSKERPEILIINDGQDRVGYNELPYKVNAISLMDFSDELKGLCIGTGGKQIRVTKEDEVFSYSEDEDGVKITTF